MTLACNSSLSWSKPFGSAVERHQWRSLLHNVKEQLHSKRPIETPGLEAWRNEGVKVRADKGWACTLHCCHGNVVVCCARDVSDTVGQPSRVHFLCHSLLFDHLISFWILLSVCSCHSCFSVPPCLFLFILHSQIAVMSPWCFHPVKRMRDKRGKRRNRNFNYNPHNVDARLLPICTFKKLPLEGEAN